MKWLALLLLVLLTVGGCLMPKKAEVNIGVVEGNVVFWCPIDSLQATEVILNNDSMQTRLIVEGYRPFAINHLHRIYYRAPRTFADSTRPLEITRVEVASR